MLKIFYLQFVCLLVLSQAPHWRLYFPAGMNSRPTQSSPNSLLVEANPLVHVIPRVKTMFSHLKMHKPLTKLFERIRGVSSLDNASASNLNDPLVTTVETLQEQLNLKGDEMIILRHQLSRMKAMIQLEKREKSQARQQYRDLLAVVDAQHNERIDKLESEFNQRMEEEKRRLVEELMHIQEEEKETTKSELLQAFNQERSALLQELKDAKDACAKALESVSQLKILIKEEEEKRSQTFAEYERREGMYLKTIEELKEVIRHQQQKYQRIPSIQNPTVTKDSSISPPPSATSSSYSKPSSSNSPVADGNMSRRLPRRPPAATALPPTGARNRPKGGQTNRGK